MDQLLVLGVLALFGLGMGSFAGATVWRLRARQLVEDKAAGEKVSSKELKNLEPLTKASFSQDRSQCLHCHHQLAWYDLIPLLSWISTGGRCRYCKAQIGWFEPVIELGVAVFFVTSYLLWPLSLDSTIAVAQFILWLAGGVGLTILFAYDLRWFLLPNVIMFPIMALAAMYALLGVMGRQDIGEAILSLVFAIIILSGLYLTLWVASKGKWIGFGDIKLGLVLALFLADWRLAFVALFAANLIGCLIVLPGLLTGKLSRGARVPFGPLLIGGGVLAMLLGQQIIEWYTSVLLF
jgi:prepilin signal peptidase PulO-like enzyme (type II secretory pathway)